MGAAIDDKRPGSTTPDAVGRYSLRQGAPLILLPDGRVFPADILECGICKSDVPNHGPDEGASTWTRHYLASIVISYPRLASKICWPGLDEHPGVIDRFSFHTL